MSADPVRNFYDREYSADRYAAAHVAGQHAFYPALRQFVDNFDLAGQRCLEVGSGRGAFQDLVSDYTGIDLAQGVCTHFHKPFVQASAVQLPFADTTFDVLWSIDTVEHVPGPEQAFAEMRRVLRPGGLLFLSPAWQCRPWAAEGYAVRPFSDFGLMGRLVKASIPVRDSVAYRAFSIFPRRVAHSVLWKVRHQPSSFLYRKLRANYDHFWTSDSDAVNSMDPFEAILWFVSRGDTCLNYPGMKKALRVRSGPLIFRVHKALA